MRRPATSQKHARQTPAGRPNTIGLRGRDLVTLLDEFDIADPICESQRDFVRWPFRYTSLGLRIIHPGGNAIDLRVACRNLSRGGLSLLHSAYIHPGSRCTVTVPHPAHREVDVDGWVVRCNHRSGMVHEIGVAFARHIDVHAFVPSLRRDMLTLERVDAAALEGDVLYVDDCDTSLKIIRHHLRNTAVRLHVRSSGLEPPHGPSDMIIVGHPARDAEQIQFISKLRTQEPSVPLIILTSQHPESARRSLAALNPDAILVRPVQQDRLLRSLGEFLIVRRRPTETRNGVQGPETPHHSNNIAHMMLHCAHRLEEAIVKNDVNACRSLCIQIAGAAPAMGLRGVGRLAMQTAEELSRTLSVHDSMKGIRSVITACHHIQSHAA